MNTKFMLVIFYVFGSVCSAQWMQTLAILSPQSGTRVTAGSTVDFFVQNNSGRADLQIQIVGSDRFPTSAGRLQRDGLSFSLPLPPDLPPGEYSVTALGAQRGSSTFHYSDEMIVHVESPHSFRALHLETGTNVFLPYIGSRQQLYPKGVKADGRWVSVGPSENLSLTTDNALVAKVRPDGSIVASGAGKTTIFAEYRNPDGTSASARVGVVVSTTKPGDLDGDGSIDLRDMDELNRYVGESVVSPSDARDLNKDGRIDALDARVLVTLCSKPRCSVE